MSELCVARRAAVALLVGLLAAAAGRGEDKEKARDIGTGRVVKVDADKGTLTVVLRDRQSGKEGEEVTLTAADDILVEFPADEVRKESKRFGPAEVKDRGERLRAAFSKATGAEPGGPKEFHFDVATRDGKEVCVRVSRVRVDK